MSNKAYVSGISLYSTYSKSYPLNGYINIRYENSDDQVILSLNTEECEKFGELAQYIMSSRKYARAKIIEDTNFRPLIGYDESKTIEEEDYEAPTPPDYHD